MSRSTTAPLVRFLAVVVAAACSLALAGASPASATSAGVDTAGAGVPPPAAGDGLPMADALPLHLLEAGPKPTPASAGRSWAEAAAADDAMVPGSLVVTSTGLSERALRDLLPSTVRAALAGPGPERLTAGVLRVSVEPGEEEAVRTALVDVPGVVAVEPEREWAYAQVPNDPELGRQWAHELSDARGAWAVTAGDRSTVIAVIDSGVDARHPDLAGRLLAQEVVTKDATGALVVRPGASDNDACGVGHGTMVAGVAAAAGDNGVGVAGVAWNARVLDIAVSASSSCGPTDAKVVAALGRIASGAHGRVDVVNLSLGGIEPAGRCPTALQTAIDQVVARGTVVVAAAGNDGTLDVQVPAACRGVIAVGATDRTGATAGYSSMARYLDVVAPGGDSGTGACTASTCILTTVRGGGYGVTQGTSFAAPYVSGVVALMRSLRPDLMPAQVESLLEQTARHPSGTGTHDHRQGWGQAQAGAALRHLRDGRAIPAPREHPAVRVAEGRGTTAPIQQAVAVSRAAFPAGGAYHAVVARDDDYADALAGSSLAYGIGPLLFARRTGSLPADTAAELRRVLAPGRTVYLLGGTAALDERLEGEIRALGLVPQRLRGDTREHTAVAVARALRSSLRRLGVTPNPVAVVATRGNWPDAVAAGSLGSAFGVPILLTGRDSLHPATAAYLGELRAQALPLLGVYVVGGGAAVSDAAAQAAGAAGRAPVQRLAGAARDATAVAIAQEMRRQLAPSAPPYAIAVDLDRADGYAHVLSASVLAGSTFSVFLPVRGPTAPSRITGVTADGFCGLEADGLLAGDVDLLPHALGGEVRDVLSGAAPRC